MVPFAQYPPGAFVLGKGSRGTAETELPVLFELTVGVDHSYALSTDLWSWTLVYSVLSWAVVWALERVWTCFYIYIYITGSWMSEYMHICNL